MDRWWFEKELLRFSHVKVSTKRSVALNLNFERRSPQEKTTWKAQRYTAEEKSIRA